MKRQERRKREKIFTLYKSMLKHKATSGNRKELRERIQEYNKGIRKTGSSKIGRESLDDAKKRYLKKQREKRSK